MNANDDLHFVSPPGNIFPKRDFFAGRWYNTTKSRRVDKKMLLVLIKLRRLVYEGSAYSPKTPPSTNWAPTRDRQTTPKMASRTAYTSQVVWFG